MVITRFLHRTLVRLLITVTIVLIAWNELFVYELHKLFWKSIECNSGNCTRILLVADPQLLGENFDKSIYKWIETADSDRYVRMTYKRALKFAKPDIVCFLGDLLDEGSVATNDQFKNYVDRFNSIFHIDDNIKFVHIPGDNDIGGENGEYISNSNIRRFEIEFMNNDIFDYQDRIRFFKINRMLLDISNPQVETNKDRLRIAVSHMPILWAGGPVLRNVLKDIDPHVIFSAHWHDSRIYIYPSSSPGSSHFYERRVEYFALDSFKSRQEYLEIAVPTSSYRMGKLRIGYGFAVIDNGNVLRYTVLWTLSRFIFLALYLIWIVIAIIIIVILNVRRRCISKILKRTHYNRISAPDF
ncbi:unnamed protein product [Hermetia illucens]|uniref:Calcineurin-like phosphoesterase domain-containing protein n=1 Tax=Hermetia illucens TaxID=343691 RepID=A0A7R8UYN5_HERIL|nr:metallophosphoesterase 1 homolog isoform X2 [Hermetia illucens]CAD7088986.1 unnamed protein product [Hermetia illucens]